MGKAQEGGFAAKHGPGAAVDPAVRAEIEGRCEASRLACAVAFAIAARLHRPAGEIGRAADLMNLRLVKCQLGLFGYSAGKKLVTAAAAGDEGLAAAIREAAEGGRLSCLRAWDIAARFRVPKLRIGGACEGLGVRIKPCQLGAF